MPTQPISSTHSNTNPLTHTQRIISSTHSNTLSLPTHPSPVAHTSGITHDDIAIISCTYPDGKETRKRRRNSSESTFDEITICEESDPDNDGNDSDVIIIN